MTGTKLRLSDAIDEFHRALEARGKKPRTIYNNLQPLHAALEIWGNIYVASIKPHHIERLFAGRRWSESTRNLYLSNLRGNFFAWARLHRHIPKDYDPTDGWRSVRVPKKERFWLPVEEFGDLLDAATCERDRAIIAIGLFTFCRGSEISGLHIRDLDFERYTVNIYREKTSQQDVLPMAGELAEELRIWLNWYENKMGGLHPDWYLVPSRMPLPMKQDEFGVLRPTGEEPKLRPLQRYGKPYDGVKRAMARLGYTEKGHGAHDLRRSGARALFDRLRSEGYDGALMRVSSMLGHADTKTTEKYLGLGIERQQRNELLAGKQMFPAMRRDRKILQIAR